MKTQEIDVLKLYAGTIKGFENSGKWNSWLSRCLRHNKLDELVNARKGIQMGMATVQRNSLMTEELAVMYARWIGSIESTMRKIVKQRHLMANDSTKNKKFQTKDTLLEKRQRDADFELFLRKNSY